MNPPSNEVDKILDAFFAEVDRIVECIPDDEEDRMCSSAMMNVPTLTMFLAMARFVRSFQTFKVRNVENGHTIVCKDVRIEGLFREYMKKVDQGMCPDCGEPLDKHHEHDDTIPPPDSYVKH